MEEDMVDRTVASQEEINEAETMEEEREGVIPLWEEYPDFDFSQTGLSQEEISLLAPDSAAFRVLSFSCRYIQNLERQVAERDRNLHLASQNLENVLLSQSVITNPDISLQSQKCVKLTRERDELYLKCVQLQSERDSMKNTTAQALNTFKKGGNGNEMMAEDEVETKKSSGVSKTESFGDISSLIEDMTKKVQIESADARLEAPLLLEFLKNLKNQKQEEKSSVNDQLKFIEEDIEKMEEKVKQLRSTRSPRKSKSPLGKRGQFQPDSDEEDENQSSRKKIKLLDSRFSGDLEKSYFQTRREGEVGGSGSALQTFSQHLSTFTRYSEIQPVLTMAYRAEENGGGMQHEEEVKSNKVAKIDFSKSEDFFAVAGDLKEVQVFSFNYDDVVSGERTLPSVPLQRMKVDSIITDLSWSKHSAGQMACSDVSGIVSLWDATDGSGLLEFREHTARVHSVAYSNTQPGILASGSADSTLRLWDVRASHVSTGQIISAGEVLCVKFNPTKDYEIVFGNTNSLAYNYDTRNLSEPLQCFTGHAGAVCGITYHKHNQIVTQSIDNSLRLWDFTKPDASIRTFQGHVNRSKFTGVSCQRDHIVCGSEDNTVVVYNINTSSPVLKHSFDTGVKEQDANKYVSAVTWNKHANVMIAANDAGIIQVCKLSTD